MNTTPTSMADLLAQFSSAAPMSSPDAAKPAPMPAPMAPAAPAAPPSGGDGGNFGGMLQKSLPMILALVARKQGGPLAGAGLLEGYARGQMQRKQAEDEALQLELQTIENAEVRAARKAEHDRKRLMERESWVRTLQEDLAKINDPEQFASFLSSAEKYGAPIHGIQPGELAQRFTFPDSRVAEAAKARAQVRIDALRKANPNNFDDMLRANAIDKATGKPLQELMATAELLVTDQAGAPMLPTPKDEFQIPNSDAGFDFRVELAAEEERLGRKLKPGERSALRRRLVNEDEARMRGRKTGGGSGGGSGSGASGGGSLADTVMANPAIYHTLTPTAKTQLAPALARRGFTQWEKPSATSTSADEAMKTATEVLQVATALRAHSGFQSIFGPLQGRTPNVRGNAVGADALRRRLVALLKLDNAGKMKGVLSDADIKMLGEAATVLNDRAISDSEAIAEVDRIISAMEGKGATLTPNAPPPAAPPPPAGQDGTGTFSVVAPDGKTYTFPHQAALDAFKRKAGIK